MLKPDWPSAKNDADNDRRRWVNRSRPQAATDAIFYGTRPQEPPGEPVTACPLHSSPSKSDMSNTRTITKNTGWYGAHPAVSTVIPGMRSLRNVDANVRAAELGPLSVEEIEILRHHRWVRNFYQAP